MINLDQTINSLIQELDLEGSEQEVLEVKAELKDKFYKVVIDTLVNNLTPEQKQEFLRILKEQQDPSVEIEKLAASVPGLLGQITDALDRELKLIRSFFGKNQ
jgi:hypothetical protein